MTSLFRSASTSGLIRLVGVLSGSTLLVAASADAQHHEWTVSLGPHTFEFRDVSRHQRPVDASPITWRGTGASVFVQHERASPKRSHRFDVSYASARRFSYTSPLRDVAAPTGDSATVLEGAYEYRRYPFADVGIGGLDVGVGARGTAGRQSLTREYAPALLIEDRRSRVAAGAMVAARFRRWRRIVLDTWWTNGLSVVRRNTEQGADSVSSKATWGGGWYDEWWATARLRLTGRSSFLIEHVLGREYFTTSHMSNTAAHRAITFGVAYGR